MISRNYNYHYICNYIEVDTEKVYKIGLCHDNTIIAYDYNLLKSTKILVVSVIGDIYIPCILRIIGSYVTFNYKIYQ